MADTQSLLGQRIVEAARLAMVLHLSQSEQTLRQRERSGGAGQSYSKEGELPHAEGEAA
jgi:hypothetical protein